MLIIDRKTGKRLVNSGDDLLKSLGEKEPINRNAEKKLEGEESSPMDPPDAYSRSHLPEQVNPGDMSGLLKNLMNEHLEASKRIDEFEVALVQFNKDGYRMNRNINDVFRRFFEFIDNFLILHNAKEEKFLFPLLHQKLVESGEHSLSDPPKTAVDILEDDHIKFIQLSSLTFNLLGLATRIDHETSRVQVFDVAYNNGRELIEMLRLHIFREDNTLFPIAHRLISKDEFLEMEQKVFPAGHIVIKIY